MILKLGLAFMVAQLAPMPVRMILPHGRLAHGSIRMNQELIKPAKTVMTGNTDRDFAAMSAEAFAREIELAKLEVRYGKNPRLKKIARFVIESHRKQRARLISIGKSFR